MKSDTLELLDQVAQAIYDKKGFNIIALDVQGLSTMTDYLIVAEGTVDRHVKALAHSIRQALNINKRQALHVEGEREGDWIVLDYGELVIHLLVPELREKYALEKLWKESKIVDVVILKDQQEKKL